MNIKFIVTLNFFTTSKTELCLFFWPLCCLFFLDVRIMITPLVSNSSFERKKPKTSYSGISQIACMRQYTFTFLIVIIKKKRFYYPQR